MRDTPDERLRLGGITVVVWWITLDLISLGEMTCHAAFSDSLLQIKSNFLAAEISHVTFQRGS